MKNVTESDMSEIDFAYQLPDISSFDTGRAVSCAVSFTHITIGIKLCGIGNILYPAEIIVSGFPTEQCGSFKALLLCRVFAVSVGSTLSVCPSSVGWNEALQMMDLYLDRL